MNVDPYSALTRRLFSEHQHRAPLAGEPAAGVSVYMDTQGVQLRLSATATDGVLDTLTFRVCGCPHLIAACEWLCRSLEGKPAAALSDVKPAAIMQTLAIPVAKTGRILVLEDAAAALGAQLSATPPA
ncbi:MAG: hypothetical protein AAGE85_13130 [Pseudomonadota bacterium]